MLNHKVYTDIRTKFTKGKQPTPKVLQELALRAIDNLYGGVYEEKRVLRAITRSTAYLVASGYTLEASEEIVADWLGLINTNNIYKLLIASLKRGE